MNQVPSLYELIKQESQEKGRKLKIVADWDDCLHAVRPLVIYYNSQITSPFEDFFQRFWGNSILGVTSPRDSKIGEYQGYPEEKKAVEDFEKKREESNKNSIKYDYKRIENFYTENNFFTSFANDLIQSLKEEYIETLVIVSSYRKGMEKGKGGWFFIDRNAETVVKEKTDKVEKTFKKFPQTKLSITGKTKNDSGRFGPLRWETIKSECPDFDIFIDDNSHIVAETAKHFPPDKKYVLPDYKANRDIKGDNIIIIKTTVSEIKDKDFSIAALELKTKQLEKGLQATKLQRERERERVYLCLSGAGILFLVVLLVIVFIRKKKKKMN